MDHWSNVGRRDRGWRGGEFDSGADVNSGSDLLLCAASRSDLRRVPRDVSLGFARADDVYDHVVE